jgi:RND superfamily putative drug exporter
VRDREQLTPAPAGKISRAFAWTVVAFRFLLVPAWIAAAVLAVLWLPGLSQSQGGALTSLVASDSPAIRAENRSAELFGLPLTADTMVVQRDPAGLSADEQADVVRRAVKLDTRGYPDLLSISLAVPLVNTLGLIPGSTERSTTAVTYLYFKGLGFSTKTTLAQEFAERHIPHGASLVGVTGAAPARDEQQSAITDALPWVTLATAILIALLVGLNFRSPVAPLVVLAAGAIGYAVDIHVLGWISERAGIVVPSEIEPLLVVLMLGIMTDYAIFYLSGQRRRLLEGHGPVEAVRITAANLAPTVVTAGLTVAAGTAATLVGQVDFIHAFGPGLALTALVGLVVATTFVPAGLALLGRLVFWPSLGRRELFAKEEGEEAEPSRRRTFRERAAYWATAKPLALLIVLLCAAGLGAAASGIAGMNLGFGLIAGLPGDSQARRAADAASKGFAPGILGVTEVDVEQRGIADRRPELARLEGLLARQPGVAGVLGPRELSKSDPAKEAAFAKSGDAARYGIVLDSDPYEDPAIDDVRHLQGDLPDLLARAGLRGAHGVVTGSTAVASDTIRAVVGDLWRIGLVALAADFLLLGIFLRAVIAPLYLLAASVLVLAATLGLTTYVFQDLLGYSGITYYVPFAVGVLLISLGSDYNVFVTGQIWKEAELRPFREAIAVATPRAARAITVAGIVLAGSFALLAIVPVHAFAEFAFAMSVGVILDTFLARSLLVPALVSLFGAAGSWPGRRLRPAHEPA